MDFWKSKPRKFFRTALTFTPTVHGDVYPSIDPSNPGLSLSGKGIAPAFVKAGVKGLVLVARGAEGLKETESQIRNISSAVDFVSVPTDISDAGAVDVLFQTIATKFGHADIVVNNAGVNINHGPLIGDQDPDLWWRNFEINVKGQFLMTRKFLHQVPVGAIASIIDITTAGAWPVIPESSGYFPPKLSALQMTPFVAESYPHVTAVAVHPGMFDTDIVPEEARDIHEYCDMEAPELVGGFVVWLSHPLAHFLTGRFVSAQWDVDELLGRKDEIVSTWRKLQLDMTGPFGMKQFSPPKAVE
ncbi:hypothetical protein PG994_012759 [Apiospora phragmitis]|uniref:NAD(P)-binding protein n=1 Tax=Apiospora phragmitis TaxID=2905665 RepID=A0ABR1TBC6_9PEZI